MPRETAADKAARLLAHGRVTVRLYDPARREVAVDVKGDSGEEHRVTWTRFAGWDCTCPNLTACSHRRAAQLICVRPLTRTERRSRT